MNKNNLKTGMRVQLRNGNIYLVLIDSGFRELVREGGFQSLENYEDNLRRWPESYGNSEWDVVAVYPHSPHRGIHIDHIEIPLWGRKRVEPKPLTHNEIEKLLGFPFELVETSEGC